MLGVDIVGEKSADEFLGPEKAKGGKAISKATPTTRPRTKKSFRLGKTNPPSQNFMSTAAAAAAATGTRVFGSCQRCQRRHHSLRY